MNCSHVLGLIDAGPFADYPPAHLEAAWAHARRCASCGSALRLATALANDLAALPEPAPPAHLAPAVLARIARLESSPTHGATDRERAVVVSRTWQDHAAAAAGIIAAGLIAISLMSGQGPAVDVTSPRIGGSNGLLAMQGTTTWWTTLAVSLVLYLTGLFAPVRRDRRSADSQAQPQA